MFNPKETKVLILGSKGMLGSDLMKVFADYQIIGLDKHNFEFRSEKSIEETILKYQPEIVINSIAYTDVNKAEDERPIASSINGTAVGYLAYLCRKYGILLIHISTDYVFSGENRAGYFEESQVLPINAYGYSKELGEQLLTEEMQLEKDDLPEDDVELPDGKYFLIRVSYLFGAHGKNIVKTFIDRICSHEKLRVVTDQYFKLTYTIDLAKQIRWLIESGEYEYGIYHITNSGELNWLDLVNFLQTRLNTSANVEKCLLSDFKSAVKRPQYSVLLNTKLPELRSWQEAVDDFLTGV
jgi:dTDP-4-dehydrorhamnose reductase